jgi:hypothetical protein
LTDYEIKKKGDEIKKMAAILDTGQCWRT